MSDKTPKVKLNESQLNEIWKGINTIQGQYDPIYTEAKELRERFKMKMTTLLNLRLFAQKYGTMSMIQKMAKVYQKLDKIDNELYSITAKLQTARSKYRSLNELFDKYVKFCKK
jgi:chromosome segregation ATPase